MTKYLIVAVALLVFLVLAWFTGSWIGLHGSDLWVLRIGLAVIGFAAAAVVVWWLRKKETSMPAAAGGQSRSVLQEIDAAIRTAEAKLKSSRTVQQRRIGELPVILIVGDTASCKTSVVAHSGLDPELLAGQVYQDNAIVPTRSVNLWFVRKVAFLETGG